MKKYLILLLFTFLSSVSYASIEINDTKIPTGFSEDFIDNLEDCDEYSEQNRGFEYKILGFDDNDNCIIERSALLIEAEGLDNKDTCSFPKDKLEAISDFYKEMSDKKEDILKGDYNIDFKMKMPEIDFSEDGDDIFNFSIKKLEMPDIKIEKIKGEIELLIEDSCK